MPYRIFIYGTTGAAASAPCIQSTNRAVVSQYDKDYWRGNWINKYMKEFDVEDVKLKIESGLGGKCQVNIEKGCGNIKFICVKTSFEEARNVLPVLHALTAENDLVLYDAMRCKSFYRDLIDDTFIKWKMREAEICRKILAGVSPVWQYKKIASYEDERDKASAFAVNLKYKKGVELQDRIIKFYETLKSGLADGEELICEDKCFIVSSHYYEITLCLEAYGKHAQFRGFYQDGQPQAYLLRRMSCFDASKWINKFCGKDSRDDIYARMNFEEMIDRYKNPADRFVRSVNISKQQRKDLFDWRYSQGPECGSEIVFNVVPCEYYRKGSRISALKIEEDSAAFILPFIHDFYPYFYKRYYLTENHLPSEMWAKIVERLREVKEMILRDTFNPELKPYIDKFNLHVLLRSRKYRNDEAAGLNKIKNEPVQFVFENRYEIARFYDVFIKWSELQLEYHGYDEGLFNIEGP